MFWQSSGCKNILVYNLHAIGRQSLRVPIGNVPCVTYEQLGRRHKTDKSV